MLRSALLVVVASVFLAAAVGGCAQSPARPASPPVQALDEGASAVRLQATIYELRVPAEKIGDLDAARLANADFAQPLPGVRPARPLYRIDQSVSLAGDKVMVGTDEPMVTNTRVTDRGQRVNSVQYNSVGAIVQFKADRAGPRVLQVTATIEMSARTESPVEVSPGVATPVVRKVNMSLKGPVELGRPAAVVSADGSSRDKDGNAVVYVARVVLGARGS